MRKLMVTCVALVAVLPLAGCNSTNPGDRAVGGAVLGGTTGAVIGGLATGRPGGAVVGGLVGAAAGATVGAATTPRCVRTGYDYYGNVICVQYQ